MKFYVTDVICSIWNYLRIEKQNNLIILISSQEIHVPLLAIGRNDGQWEIYNFFATIIR